MLHARHYLTWVRREILDYVFLSLLWTAAALAVFKLFPPEEASGIAGLLFTSFILILSVKAVLRRIFFIHHTPLSEYKTPGSLTSAFLFSWIFSVAVLCLFFGIYLVILVTGTKTLQAPSLFWTAGFTALLIPSLLFETASAHVSRSGMPAAIRVLSAVTFVSSFLFPLTFHPDFLMIAKLLFLSAVIRLILFIFFLLDSQLLDLFLPGRENFFRNFTGYLNLFKADAVYWLFLLSVFWIPWLFLDQYDRLIWTLGSFLFLVILTGLTQLMALWSLIFKNFIRLNLPDQFILYARHLNVWHIMTFFSFVPFLLLILTPLVEFEFPRLPAGFNWIFLLVSMSFLAIGSYFLTNPMAELLVLLGRKKELAWITVSSAAGFILASVFFTSLTGPWGFSFALIFSGFFYWAGINILIQQLLSCDYHFLFPTKKLIRILIASVFSLTAGLLLIFIPVETLNKMGWIFGIYFGTYLILIAYFGVLKSDTHTGFINWTRRIGNFH